MKLTKEHLASYLPYNLKIQWHNGDIGYLRGIDQFRNNEYFKDGVSAQVTSDEENDDNDVFPANLVQIKPVLHPLSHPKKATAGELMKKYNCSIDVIQEIWELADNRIELKDIKLETYNVMCKNHIDFNRLIPNNLAIDINTIK